MRTHVFEIPVSWVGAPKLRYWNVMKGFLKSCPSWTLWIFPWCVVAMIMLLDSENLRACGYLNDICLCLFMFVGIYLYISIVLGWPVLSFPCRVSGHTQQLSRNPAPWHQCASLKTYNIFCLYLPDNHSKTCVVKCERKFGWLWSYWVTVHIDLQWLCFFFFVGPPSEDFMSIISLLRSLKPHLELEPLVCHGCNTNGAWSQCGTLWILAFSNKNAGESKVSSPFSFERRPWMAMFLACGLRLFLELRQGLKLQSLHLEDDAKTTTGRICKVAGVCLCFWTILFHPGDFEECPFERSDFWDIHPYSPTGLITVTNVVTNVITHFCK